LEKNSDSREENIIFFIVDDRAIKILIIIEFINRFF